MVSDLAPIELLIQRAGRLHRHDRGNRGRPILHILSPPETNNPDADWYKNSFPKASYVYKNTSVLWRTKEILKQEKSIILPRKARVLVESVYGNNPIHIPDCFSDSELDADGEKKAYEDIADFSKLAIEDGYCRESAMNEGDEEERITTRLNEEQSTVYLCIYDGEKIKPLYSGDFPWEMSSLKIYKNSLGDITYKTEIEKIISNIKTQKRFRDDDIFLLTDEEHSKCTIIEPESEQLHISYSSTFGLKTEKK